MKLLLSSGLVLLFAHTAMAIENPYNDLVPAFCDALTQARPSVDRISCINEGSLDLAATSNDGRVESFIYEGRLSEKGPLVSCQGSLDDSGWQVAPGCEHLK